MITVVLLTLLVCVGCSIYYFHFTHYTTASGNKISKETHFKYLNHIFKHADYALTKQMIADGFDVRNITSKELDENGESDWSKKTALDEFGYSAGILRWKVKYTKDEQSVTFEPLLVLGSRLFPVCNVAFLMTIPAGIFLAEGVPFHIAANCTMIPIAIVGIYNYFIAPCLLERKLNRLKKKWNVAYCYCFVERHLDKPGIEGMEVAFTKKSKEMLDS